MTDLPDHHLEAMARAFYDALLIDADWQGEDHATREDYRRAMRAALKSLPLPEGWRDPTTAPQEFQGDWLIICSVAGSYPVKWKGDGYALMSASDRSPRFRAPMTGWMPRPLPTPPEGT